MKLTEGGKLDRPNLCTICERTPEIGAPVVDTEKYFDGYPHNLQGRRYVCDKCADSINRLIQGDVTEEQHQLVVEELSAKTRELLELKRLFEDLGAKVGSIR